jgi:hypothetical protein
MASSKHLQFKLLIVGLSLIGGSAFSALPSANRSIGISVPKSVVRSPHQIQKHRRVHQSIASTARCASASASTTASNGGSKSAAIATFLLILIDTQLRSLFTKYSIAFPSSLAGCGALFSSMILLDILSGSDKKWGEMVYNTLNPGATLLAKWLPVFFVPGLITLPLASGLGNVYEVSSS